MPQPTPTAPGEEPVDESSLYRYHLRRLITWYLEALDPLPPAAFNWQPPSPQANTLAAICTHAISSAEWWVLSCVGNGPLERDRDAEFAAETSWAELRPRFASFLARAEDLLAGMDSARLAAISRNPAGNRMNRRCLLHTVEHLGLHLGHVEVTIDWWRSATEGEEQEQRRLAQAEAAWAEQPWVRDYDPGGWDWVCPAAWARVYVAMH